MDYIDPINASPDRYHVLLENASGRVLDMWLPPGQIDNLHSHPASMVYFIKGSQARIHVLEGETMEITEMTIPDGYVLVHGPWTHRVENVGTTAMHGIIFEAKR